MKRGACDPSSQMATGAASGSGPPPDGRLELHGHSGQFRARCSLWWEPPLVVNGRPAGLIGHYDATTAEAAATLLDQACDQLRDRGCALAIGPMDGSTWASYRFVTGGTDEPPFFLEPSHPPEWPAHFEAAGFAPLARYHSTITDDLDGADPKVDRAEARLAASGCRFRHLDLSRLEKEMLAIHRVSLAAFQQAYLYQPISFDSFAAAQAKLAPLLRPELVLMAERNEELVGFAFAIPDVLQAQRGLAPDTAIIKTLAILPGRAQAGLGVVLVGRLHRTARELGFRRVVHALMHEANGSQNIRGHASRLLREYTLFARTL
jgi:GNAT superfamily N-acetyltransferase